MAGNAQAQTIAALRAARAPISAPALLAPRLPAPNLGGAATTALPRAVIPVLVPSAIPKAPTASARGVAAVHALVESGSKSVADFAAAKPTAQPAAAARGAGDALWDAVTGEAVAAVSAVAEALPPQRSASLLPAPSAEKPYQPTRRLHLLSKPLNETSRLGPTARWLHYILETAVQFAKAALLWQATGSLSAGIALLVVDLLKMPPIITTQSLIDLQARIWWRRRAVLRELAAEPGVTGIRVLTTGKTEFSGILAWRKESTGLIFVEADRPLPAEVGRFGAPIPIEDMATARTRLSLHQAGTASPVSWTPTLAELLAGRAIPEEVAAAWRAALAEEKSSKGWLAGFFDYSKEKSLRIDAALIAADGSERALGTVALGSAARALAGASRMDRLMARVGRAPHGRAIPLTEALIERGGQRQMSGFWARGWARLTARLIRTKTP